MKKACVKILAVIIIVILFAGCQATPEQDVVIGKGDGQLEEKISQQTDAPLPSDLPESGTRVTEMYKHDSLDITIEVDALVETQDGKTMPAAKVTPYKFTQEDVDRVYEHFVGDAHFFQIPDGEGWALFKWLAVEDIQTQIDYAKTKSDRSNDYEDHIERLNSNLEKARQEYLTAKEASDFPETAHTLRDGNLVSGETTGGFSGYFEKEEAAYRLSVSNDENGMSSVMSLERIGMDVGVMEVYEEMLGISAQVNDLDAGESLRELSYDDALSVAEETVNAFGAEGMALAQGEAKQYPEDTLQSFYTFIFTHAVNGVPCIYNAIAIANDEGYNDVWDYEKLIVEVDAHGLKRAHWSSPCDITEQLAQSTVMIPFEDVMSCFSKMVFIKNSYLENELDMTVTKVDDSAEISGETMQDAEVSGERYDVESVIVKIERITLGLMRVQSGDEYLLIPVWDFYGYTQRFTADGKDIGQHLNEGAYDPIEQCLLTINAIDGSVINLEQGY